MSDSPANRVSIYGRLLRWMLLPLVGLLLITAVFGYPIALYPATAAYDWALVDAAHSLGRLLQFRDGKARLGLPSSADTLLRTDQFDRIYYAVHDTSGRFVSGDRQLAMVPPSSLAAGDLLYDSEIGGERVRVAAALIRHPDGNAVVQVAETTVKRHRLGQQILTGVIFIEIVLLGTSAVLLSIGILKGLEPLQRVRQEIAARSPRDLRPVPDEQVPVELRSIVRALNDLLRQLADALQAQQHFIANAAHQLRTPIAGLRAQVEYGLREDDPAEWRRTLMTLGPATERIVHLAHQLLTLAKAEGGAPQLESARSVDLRTIAEEVTGQFMPRAIAKDLDLGIELEPATVRGDAFLVGELLANLLDNAIRYGGDGGRVTVRCGQRNGCAMLEVEDDGPGIPTEERERVFRRFHRVSGSPGDGCGLGLAIVEEIAHLHGGVAEIGPGESGRGTRVTVRFRDAHAASA